MIATRQGVSFVVPVYNGRRWLASVIDGIEAQRDGRPFEIIVVDDGSRDGSRRVLKEAEAAGRLRIIDGPRRGSAAALNAGLREAQYSIICQIDQDVILQPGWLPPLLSALEDPGVAAAQGHYVTAPDAGFWARVMGRDLEQRYADIPGDSTDHVCTGNSAYRASALHQCGLFDEEMGYGSDNDLSYRLTDAGYRLAFCRSALSVHRWRDDPRGYLRQQFGVGYGRLDILAKHPHRVTGDDVSGAVMMAHGPLMAVALACLVWAGAATVVGASFATALGVGLGILLLLFTERAWAGVIAWRRSRDATALSFCLVHLLRDLAWVSAVTLWTARRLTRVRRSPAHSMYRGREADPQSTRDRRLNPYRVLAIVPAFNEASNLPRVVGELRERAPGLDILVVNDGSTDGTVDLLPGLGVSWLSLTERVGVGGAVRVGLRYAVREGYEYVVRVDGDGQHRACDIRRLLAPVCSGRLDAVIGSRYLGRPLRWRSPLRISQAALARCLSLLTGTRITDPTSGFWLFGPRAIRLLGKHHPTGYGEPELALFLSRNGLRFGEIAIRMRPRIAGRTSITPARASLAFGRTVLAMMIVPIRRMVEGQGHD
jgi:glycosyltransferase involved in cell wall biosynthesis